METYNKEGSNWIFDGIDYFEVVFSKFNPLKGSSYIELPDNIKNKKAVINIKNEDDKCFAYCVARAMNMKDNHPERVDKELKKEVGKLHFGSIKFPVKVEDIKKIERLNKDISVNVYEFTKDKTFIVLKNSIIEKKNHVDLLLISDRGNLHYTLINNMSRLFASEISKSKEKSIFVKDV